MTSKRRAYGKKRPGLLNRILTACDHTSTVTYMGGSVRPRGSRDMSAAPQVKDISNQLVPLRNIVHSLKEAAHGNIPAGNLRRKLVRCVKSAGDAAVPSLVRALTSASESES